MNGTIKRVKWERTWQRSRQKFTLFPLSFYPFDRYKLYIYTHTHTGQALKQVITTVFSLSLFTNRRLSAPPIKVWRDMFPSDWTPFFYAPGKSVVHEPGMRRAFPVKFKGSSCFRGLFHAGRKHDRDGLHTDTFETFSPVVDIYIATDFSRFPSETRNTDRGRGENRTTSVGRRSEKTPSAAARWRTRRVSRIGGIYSPAVLPDRAARRPGGLVTRLEHGILFPATSPRRRRTRAQQPRFERTPSPETRNTARRVRAHDRVVCTTYTCRRRYLSDRRRPSVRSTVRPLNGRVCTAERERHEGPAVRYEVATLKIERAHWSGLLGRFGNFRFNRISVFR